MKKILQSVLLSIVFVLGVTRASTAQAASAQTLITGYVLEDGAPLSDGAVIASYSRYFADTDVRLVRILRCCLLLNADGVPMLSWSQSPILALPPPGAQHR